MKKSERPNPYSETGLPKKHIKFFIHADRVRPDLPEVRRDALESELEAVIHRHLYPNGSTHVWVRMTSQ